MVHRRPSDVSEEELEQFGIAVVHHLSLLALLGLLGVSAPLRKFQKLAFDFHDHKSS